MSEFVVRVKIYCTRKNVLRPILDVGHFILERMGQFLVQAINQQIIDILFLNDI